MTGQSSLTTWWRATVGGLPRPFWAVWAGQLVNRLGYFVQPFLTLYLVRERGLPVSTAGALVAAFGAGALVSHLLGGWLVDRVGRRPTLLLGMLGTAAAMLGLGFSTSLPALAGFAVATGLFVDLYRPAVAALVADLVPPHDRPRAFALLYWAINLGVSVASVVGGALAGRGYWLLFVLDAVTCVVFAGVIWATVPETRAADRPAGAPSGYGQALRDRLLLALTASTLLGACVYVQCFVTLPLSMSRDGLGPGDYGLAYAVNPLAIVLLQPLTLRWLTGLPQVPVYASSSVVMGIGFAATVWADSVPAYAGTVFVWTLGEIAFNAVAPSLVADIAPPDQRGRYSGVLGVAFGCSALVGPLAGTALLDSAGEPVLWGTCLVASVGAAALALLLGPALHQRRRDVVAAG